MWELLSACDGVVCRCVLELHAIAAKKEEGGGEFAVAMTAEERLRFLRGIDSSFKEYYNAAWSGQLHKCPGHFLVWMHMASSMSRATPFMLRDGRLQLRQRTTTCRVAPLHVAQFYHCCSRRAKAKLGTSLFNTASNRRWGIMAKVTGPADFIAAVGERSCSPSCRARRGSVIAEGLCVQAELAPVKADRS